MSVFCVQRLLESVKLVHSPLVGLVRVDATVCDRPYMKLKASSCQVKYLKRTMQSTVGPGFKPIVPQP